MKKDKKGFFKRIIEWFKNRRNIKKTYCAFFNLQQRKEKSYQLMDDITIDVENIYHKIKDKPKYTELVSYYNNYNEIKEKHNYNINYINITLEKFNYNEILSNIEKYSLDSIINTFNITFDLINEIKIKSEQYKNFIKYYEEIINNFDLIQNQHIKYILLNQIQDLKSYDYIDGKQKETIINIINNIKKEVKTYSKQFYNFNFIDIENEIYTHNVNFVIENSKDKIFDNINGKSLDSDQRATILKDDISNLTVAGAGSGKTLTICGKVKYLLERKNIDPQDILLLSYSHKSAEDLNKKVSNISQNLNVHTFHALGLDILKHAYNNKMTVEEQFKAIVKKYFDEEIFKDKEKLNEFINYYGLYMNDSSDIEKYEDEGEMFANLKNQDLTTLKDELNKYKEDKQKLITLQKELVKSKQELAIANFYFLNGIKYEYEKSYEVKTCTYDKRQYTPDFYLTDYHIYHEHYGIDKEGRAKQYNPLEEKIYLEGMEWKRNTHSNNNTKCLETYSYQFNDNTIYSSLIKQLKDNNVEFKPLSMESIINIMHSLYSDYSFNSFKNLISTFVNLYKANYNDNSGFEILKRSHFPNSYARTRSILFLDICKGLYDFYMNHIRSEGKIDFDDMILKSINLLPNIEDYKYKYIIVDEFQDISQSRLKFLQALIEHGNSKLFAVGDDWQAIYRFSGCDVNIFLNFEKYFKYSKINFIYATHRNSKELQDIAGNFIMKNENQIKKTIQSNKHLVNPIKIIYYKYNKYNALLNIFEEISLIDPCAHIMLLGRNNSDIKSLLSKQFFKDHENPSVLICKEYPNLKIRFSTVHGSKGLEDDYVVIINTEDKKYGFPNKVEDDPVLNLVLSKQEKYKYAEERRLWYVALTRTRNYTFLIVDVHSVSSFVKEIVDECSVMNPQVLDKYNNELKCPKCKSGHLVVKCSPDGKSFYGCSNYPYCDYKNRNVGHIDKNHRCKKCGDYMVLKYGKYGYFYGCHNYPECDYKENLKNEEK